jgi:hypothetical protein
MLRKTQMLHRVSGELPRSLQYSAGKFGLQIFLNVYTEYILFYIIFSLEQTFLRFVYFDYSFVHRM